MKFTKVRNVKSPIRGTKCSAGIDFFVPEFNDKFISDLILKNSEVLFEIDDNNNRYIALDKQERILIPSGIHVHLPRGYALMAKNKSGIASKKGLDKLAELVDEDYQGEIHINLVNTSNSDIRIYENEKIIQFVLVPVCYDDPHEINSLIELYPIKTDRGEGGFGSTNNK